MRSIPQVWRQAYIAGNHNYVVTINMTLADGTTLTIGNDDIWEGGFSIEEGTSDENTFSIGSAIIGKCTVILNNISEKFSGYDFFNAEFNAYLNLVGLSTQNLRIGHYTVDETSYNGSLITLTTLNNMWRFDIPFSEINYTFTAYTTAQDVINAMCQYSGIGILLATQQFQGYNFILSKPEQDLNCREVLQYIAQATCNYCVINDVGNLELRWYDKSIINNIQDWDGGTFNTTTTPYSDGCNRDGGQWYWDGDTYVWTQGDDADGGYFYDGTSTIGYITQNNSIEVGTDGIVVTGVKVCSSNQDNDKAYDYSWHDADLEQTHPRYTLVIQDNVFINKTNALERLSVLSNILKNLPLRSFTASSVNDISIEAGDPVAISDYRGNRFYTYVTNVRFQTNNSESFSCGVESVTQNKVVRYSNEIKTLVEAQRNAQTLVSAYDQAVQRMNNIAVNAMGAYEAYDEVADARIYYLSNKPISKNAQGQCVFTANSTVYKITGDGFFVSTNGGQTFVNGYSGGELVVNVLDAIGINADWINAGHITADRIQGNTLTLGGQNNGNGQCVVKASNGSTNYVKLDNTGINARRGYIGNGTSGWEIQDSYIRTNSGPTSVSAISVSGTCLSTSGFLNSNGTKYTQITSGKITSNNVDLTGKISASGGNIGQWYIDDADQDLVAEIDDSTHDSKAKLNAGIFYLRGLNHDDNNWTIFQANANKSYFAVRGGHVGSGSQRRATSFTVTDDVSTFNPDRSPWNGNYVDISTDNISSSIHGLVAWADEVSDKRTKTNISDISPKKIRQFFKSLKPSSFKFKKSTLKKDGFQGLGSKLHYGVIAQNIQESLENAKLSSESIVKENTHTGFLTVKYRELHGLELAGIKDLYELVQKQQEEIDLLKQELAELKARKK